MHSSLDWEQIAYHAYQACPLGWLTSRCSPDDEIPPRQNIPDFSTATNAHIAMEALTYVTEASALIEGIHEIKQWVYDGSVRILIPLSSKVSEISPTGHHA